MAVHAKFFISEATKIANGGYAEPKPLGRVTMRPVTRGEANKDWASSTPGGEFSMTVTTDAFGWFYDRVGEEVSITIEHSPKDPPA